MSAPITPSAEAVALVSGGMLTVREAQKKYGLSRDKLRALMRDGTFHFAVIDEKGKNARQEGGTRVIPEREIVEYLARLLQRAT